MPRKPDNETDEREQHYVYWRQCTVCGGAYGFNNSYCPHCSKKGFIVGLTGSDATYSRGDKYPPGYLTFPMATKDPCHIGDIILDCLVCQRGGHCEKAGEYNYYCPPADFDYCPCKRCCAANKASVVKQDMSHLNFKKKLIDYPKIIRNGN